jgi:hypothetical protein
MLRTRFVDPVMFFSRPRQGDRVPVTNGVTDDGRNDRCCRSGLLDSSQAHRTRRKDQVEVKMNQFGGQTRKLAELAVCIAVFY